MHRGRHPFYEDAKRPTPGQFAVVHFAGKVKYYVEGFLEKNNDTLHADLEDMARASKSPFVAGLFAVDVEDPAAADGPGGRARASSAPGGGGALAATIASKFKSQLQVLYDALLATSPHYVRCIKPNALKRPNVFERPMVMDQLLYAGVLETVRIRQQGFPVREDYVAFWRRAATQGCAALLPAGEERARFASVEAAPGTAAAPPQGGAPLFARAVEACRALCAVALRSEQWAAGRTRLFLKHGALEDLRAALQGLHARRLQAWARMATKRRAFRALRRGVVRLQRGFLYKRWKRQFKAAEAPLARLQACVRRRAAQRAYRVVLAKRAAAAAKIAATVLAWRTRRAFSCLRTQLTRMQALARGARGRAVARVRRRAVAVLQDYARFRGERRGMVAFLQQRRSAAVRLQALARGARERSNFKRLRSAAVTLQSFARGVAARREALVRRWACVVLLRFARRVLARCAMRGLRTTVLLLQSWWRGILARSVYKQRLGARTRIGRVLLATRANRQLAAWLSDLMAACAWGYANRAEHVLLCGAPEYTRMLAVPLASRCNVHDWRDGFQTPLHLAAASGSVDTVNMLLRHGARKLPLDRFKNAPLHRAAMAGDTHEPVLQALHSALRQRGAGAQALSAADKALEARNRAGETVLAAAVNAARSSLVTAARVGGLPTHTATLRFLLVRSAPNEAQLPGCGLTRARIKELLDQAAAPPAAAQRAEGGAASLSVGGADPHAAFFLLRDEEKRKRLGHGHTPVPDPMPSTTPSPPPPQLHVSEPPPPALPHGQPAAPPAASQTRSPRPRLKAEGVLGTVVDALAARRLGGSSLFMFAAAGVPASAPPSSVVLREAAKEAQQPPLPLPRRDAPAARALEAVGGDNSPPIQLHGVSAIVFVSAAPEVQGSQRSLLRLLDAHRVCYAVLDIADPQHQALCSQAWGIGKAGKLFVSARRHVFPQLFCRSSSGAPLTFVGGWEELRVADAAGALDKMLIGAPRLPAQAPAASPPPPPPPQKRAPQPFSPRLRSLASAPTLRAHLRVRSTASNAAPPALAQLTLSPLSTASGSPRAASPRSLYAPLMQARPPPPEPLPPPPPPPPAPPARVGSAAGSLLRALSIAAPPPPAPPMPPPPPPAPAFSVDVEGLEREAAAAAAATAPLRTGPPPSPEGAPPKRAMLPPFGEFKLLPLGKAEVGKWQCCISVSTGLPFWHCAATGETSWIPPHAE